jgi:hypothetical protein
VFSQLNLTYEDSDSWSPFWPASEPFSCSCEMPTRIETVEIRKKNWKKRKFSSLRSGNSFELRLEFNEFWDLNLDPSRDFFLFLHISLIVTRGKAEQKRSKAMREKPKKKSITHHERSIWTQIRKNQQQH